MEKIRISLAIFALFITGCEKQENKKDVTKFSLLNENSFILQIDRVASGQHVQFPHDTLQESDYTETNEDIQYEITFLENARIVTIESTGTGSVSGERSNDGETSKRYELNEGLFAGGRFLIWISNDHFEAEYTLYGSGVPIIRSERGRLISNE
jgi:hypothetical protein